ncbi:tetratricopeptide repeat protein [Aerosakkonema funiforme]|uniref:tetratricopeptide repeat protein n=1 Tax=Aerosakkonema funiforme TaxID=1246630 RepID=UPI0035B91119
MTQEFYVCVTPIEEDKYLVRAESLALGVRSTQAQVVWPVENWLAQAAKLLHSSPAESTPQSLAALGQQLYSALFQGTLLSSWTTAQEIARSKPEVLRLRLSLEDDRLARLPWELLYIGDLGKTDTVSPDSFLVLSTSVAFSRCVAKQSSPDSAQNFKGDLQGTLQIFKANFSDKLDNDDRVTELHESGIPCVLTIPPEIPNEVASTFTELVYDHISQVYPVEISLSLVRQELISIYGFDRFYWVLPIVYLHPQFDGFVALPQQTLEVGEFDRSDTQAWSEFGDESMCDDFDDDEDSAFISGLLGQISKPNLTPELANQIVTGSDVNAKLPAQPIEERSISVPITARSESARDVTSHPIVTETKDREEIEAINSDLKVKNSSERWYSTVLSDRPLRNLLPSRNKAVLLLPLAVLLLTPLSFWLFRQRWSQVGSRSASFIYEEVATPRPQPKISAKTSALDIKKTSSVTVSAMAVKHFKQGNLLVGQRMVKVLLDRGDIKQAKAALATLSKEQKSNPDISFLFGRLAWQSVRVGDKSYSLDDARRYWETAVKGREKSPLYYNALGFAYYAQGNLTRANQTWFEALYRAEEQKVAESESASRERSENFAQIPTKSVVSHDALTAYAGLALVLNHSAKNQPIDERSRLLDEALKLRTKVMQDDPTNFKPSALQANWLWSKQAVEDWRSLLQMKR